MAAVRFRRNPAQRFGIFTASVDRVLDDRPVHPIDIEVPQGVKHAVRACRDKNGGKRRVRELDVDNVTVIDRQPRPCQIIGGREDLRDLATRGGQDEVDRMAPTAKEDTLWIDGVRSPGRPARAFG